MTWKVTLPCTQAEAERLQEQVEEFAEPEPLPVVVTTEETPDRWRLDAFFETKPDSSVLDALLALVPSAEGVEPLVQRLEEQDWVTLSQQGLEPIHAGRFFVHTPQHRGAVPPDAIALEIDAGRAFGTGQHETTTGCLLALDRLRETGLRFENILDLGTGTGLLAFAALKLWPEARVAASDIDPVSIEVTEENAGVNRVPLGQAPGEVELAVAAGLDHPRLAARAPYDLLIANILAAPLIVLAPAIGAALAPGGRLILAGLLDTQAERVEGAYRRLGLTSVFRIVRGDWPTLVMRKRRALGWR